MHHGLRLLSRAAPVLLALATACKDSNDASEPLLTVSGPITNVSGTPVPSSARAVVAWVVTSGPGEDYAYVFGEGRVQGSRFTVSFIEAPPAEALNLGQIGVGVVVLTTNAALRTGVHLEDVALEPGDLLGATGRYAVIYKATESVDRVDWAGPFPLGFSAGSGVDRENDFDAFEPADPSSLELIVDDLENIDFVNWT